MSEANLKRRAIRRIFIVATAGMLLLLFDFFVGFDTASLHLMGSGDRLYLIRPAAGDSAGHIRLKADIKTNTGTVSKNYELRLYPYTEKNNATDERSDGSGKAAGAMSEEELLAYEMRSVISSLNDDQSVRRVALPDRLRTGEKIRWTAPCIPIPEKPYFHGPLLGKQNRAPLVRESSENRGILREGKKKESGDDLSALG